MIIGVPSMSPHVMSGLASTPGAINGVICTSSKSAPDRVDAVSSNAASRWVCWCYCNGTGNREINRRALNKAK